MGQRCAANFLDLTVGHYRLAVRADAVLGVVRDVTADPPFSFRGQPVMLVDLSTYFGGPPRPCAPFAVVLESNPRWLAMGVDAVGSPRLGEDPTVVAVPSFGLRHAGVFAGALRIDDALLLVLQPDALQSAVAATTTACGDEGGATP